MNWLAFIPARLWLAIAFVAALAGSYGAGRWHQMRHDDQAAMEARLEATQEARRFEQAKQREVDAQVSALSKRLRNVGADRDRLLGELRDRPGRMPNPAGAPAICDGATGRQLSREDAEFLARLAAERDDLAARLLTLQEWAKTVTTK